MLKCFSPAKINLFLRVVGKRPDGYHELSSLFQTIDLGDQLYFEVQAQDHLTCTDPSIPTDQTNLILKATDLFRRKTGLTIGLKVYLEKKIPSQAGLGGGSSNAATTLWAFNQIAGNIASLQELQNWSAEIGSDVPFFFSQGTAYCTGRGEKVASINPLDPRSFWVVKPPIDLSTPEIYRRVSLKQGNKAHNDLDQFLSSPSYFNDLEQAAFEARPELVSLKSELLQYGFDTVLMTGSGSAFFCMGQGEIPSNSNLLAFSTRFINRPSFKWYKTP
jgi:4-diphosphocytidyl-2-C-methyl-D-erythritol kinase